jgi:hypothetical protein
MEEYQKEVRLTSLRIAQMLPGRDQARPVVLSGPIVVRAESSVGEHESERESGPAVVEFAVAIERVEAERPGIPLDCMRDGVEPGQDAGILGEVLEAERRQRS